MLGQAQTPRRRLLGIAAVALVILVVPAVGGADPTNTADALRQENSDLAARSRAAVLSVYALDSRLGTARARLASLGAEAERLRAERASLSRQLHVARKGVTISQRRLASRLRTLYEQDDVSAIEIVLGSKTLEDVLARLDSVDRFAALDRAVLTEVRTAKRRLTSSSRAIAQRAARLAAATREAKAAALSLQRAKAEREAYIAWLATQRRLNDAQIARVEAAALAAQVRARELAAAAAMDSEPAVAADAVVTATAGDPPQASSATDTHAVTVTVTGYALSGTTASGLPAGWGVAAVDPGVIPLGTRISIPGYGEAVAADTGGAVAGGTIDLWFPSEAQARAWGRRTVTVAIR